MNQGAEILFLTPHAVLASPYHMDRSGNLDTIAFFTARNPAEAKTIAKRRGAELVIFCNLESQITPYLTRENTDHPNFIQLLAAGRIPNWLKPIKSPTMGNLLMFEVRK